MDPIRRDHSGQTRPLPCTIHSIQCTRDANGEPDVGSGCKRRAASAPCKPSHEGSWCQASIAMMRQLSLVREFDLGRRSVRLHDVVRSLLRERLGNDRLAELETALVDGWR